MAEHPEHWEDTAPREPEGTFRRGVPTTMWWLLALITLLVIAGVSSVFLYV